MRVLTTTVYSNPRSRRPDRFRSRAGLAAAGMLSCLVLSGCITDRQPERGVKALLDALSQNPPPSCLTATQFAHDLQFWGKQQAPETIGQVANLIKTGGLCEEARMELVRVLELAQARNQLPEMIDCLDGVNPKESKLADELAALIVDFSSTFDEVFVFVRRNIASPHITLRYGCVDLLKTYFKPGVKPVYGNEIVDLLMARVNTETDPAVAELACAALGEMGLGADTDRRAEIRKRLEDVSNDIQRKYPGEGERGQVPRRTAEDVRRMAVDYSFRLQKS